MFLYESGILKNLTKVSTSLNNYYDHNCFFYNDRDTDLNRKTGV